MFSNNTIETLKMLRSRERKYKSSADAICETIEPEFIRKTQELIRSAFGLASTTDTRDIPRDPSDWNHIITVIGAPESKKQEIIVLAEKRNQELLSFSNSGSEIIIRFP